VNDQVYRQRANALDQLKARTTAAIVNVVKDMVQRDWQEVDYRWDVYRAIDGSHCHVFLT
jgi:hypothetical protein